MTAAKTNTGKPKRRWRRRLGCLAMFLVTAIAVAWAVTSCTSGSPRAIAEIAGAVDPNATNAQPTFTVMTLNLAHGRGTSFHQWLLGNEEIEANLTRAAGVIRDAGADLVALQEADGPSRWSGSFDHIRFVAEAAGLRFRVRGAHVSGLGLSYGTALVSRHPMRDGISGTFAPSPPTFSKGFVTATVDVPAPGGTRAVRFVSVHLDFARHSTRKSQVDELIGQLREARSPLILCGDFNCTWTDEDSPVRHLAESLRLHAAVRSGHEEDSIRCLELRRRFDRHPLADRDSALQLLF